MEDWKKKIDYIELYRKKWEDDSKGIDEHIMSKDYVWIMVKGHGKFIKFRKNFEYKILDVNELKDGIYEVKLKAEIL